MDKIFYPNSIQNWVFAGSITILVFVFSYFIKPIVQRRLVLLVQKTATDWDDMAIALFKRIHLIFLLALAIYLGSRVLELPENINGFLSSAFLTIFLMQVA